MTGFLKGKVAVITGGASGIGLAVVRAFLSQGARAAILDMDEAALADREKEFSGRFGSVLCLSCDVTQELSCRSAVDEVILRFGRIDILFNNAGITQRGLFERTDTQVFEKVMAVNFFGSLYCTKAALPHLIQSRGSIIVNESIAGVAPLLGRTGYSASKHALHGLFTSLRCELRHKGVHVMIVCPGFIRTNLQTRALGANGNVAAHEQTRMGKEDTPENVAREMIRGLEKKRSMVVLTLVGKLGWLVSRFFPILYEHLMTRQFKKELSVE